ncbi:MAG: cysteine--tRNA ligase, partial [Bacteroidota bacterium]
KMKAGARVAVNEEKHHPADFALWKKADLGWESKWGTGFPGWHIECTAMIFATLARHIDVHTGGEDLQYTHHNAEIAQAECATKKEYVNYWLHNAHITIAGDKIAKSTGNGLTLGQLKVHGFNPLTYRYWLLQSHYRTTTNFSLDALGASKQALERLHRVVYDELAGITPTKPHPGHEQAILGAIHDDLDTPKALAAVWDTIKDTTLKPGEKLATLHVADTLLNLGLQQSVADIKAARGEIAFESLSEDIQEMVHSREAARIAQNWDEADRLREALRLKGYEVSDSTHGSVVSKM